MKACNMALSELDFHHKMDTLSRFGVSEQLPPNKNAHISLGLFVTFVTFKSDRGIVISIYLFMKLQL